jgi:hypothetical protein
MKNKIGVIGILLMLSLIVIPSVYGANNTTSSTQIFGSQSSSLCQFYKAENFQAYQNPLIAGVILIGITIIAYEAFKRLSAERKEGENSEADLAAIMSRTMTIIIITIILMGAIVLALSLLPIIMC